MPAVLFPNDHQFEYEALRALGHSAYGGAEAGEVLAICERITPGDYDAWYAAWRAAADRVADEAQVAWTRGHRVSARDGWLRASNYYRTAEFFLHGDPGDPRMSQTYELSVRSFERAAPLLEPAVEPVEIPYDGVRLHGYHYRAARTASPDSGPRHPVILMHNGFDGTAEEMHFFGAAAAAQRGYDVVTFDGPGQASARHRHGLTFRPDWEHVVSQVLDWALELPEIDTTRVGLLGLSLGGLLAPRAAAFEQRIAACAAVDGVYDMGIVAASGFPVSRQEAEGWLRADSAPEIDALLAQIAAKNPTARWSFGHGCWALGADTPRHFLAPYLDYTLAGLAERITCPTLVCEAENDMFFDGQPALLMEHLTCSKTLLRMTSDEGAGLHCHVGAQRLAFGRVCDWFDSVLGLAHATGA